MAPTLLSAVQRAAKRSSRVVWRFGGLREIAAVARLAVVELLRHTFTPESINPL